MTEQKEPMTTLVKRVIVVLTIFIAITIGAGIRRYATSQTQVDVNSDIYMSGEFEFNETAPTPIFINDLEVNGEIEWLWTDWYFDPEEDWVIEINWLSSILITDVFSVTTVIAGPATVRFSKEE